MRVDRFRDDGHYLADFSDELWVRCPQCNNRAIVKAPAEPSSLARIACTHCGYAHSRTQNEQVRHRPSLTVWQGQCESCGHFLRKTQRYHPKLQPSPTIVITCSACRRRTRLRLVPSPLPARLGHYQDPYFGLPLWLQTSCGGEVLWALNDRHLFFLCNYVNATLREREPNRNTSLASRLPRWITSRKNRDTILRCIEQLQATF